MRQRGNRTKPRGEFAREVTKVLIAKDWNNTVLWKGLALRGEAITPAFMDMVVAGTRHPPVDLIDPICAVLEVSAERRISLHKAAAVDRGYRLDLEAA